MFSEILISKTELPSSNKVEPEKIARMLDDNSASYKFFWFLAILNACIEKPTNFVFSLKNLFMDMLYYSYYSVNECHLYLGVGDILEKTSKSIFNEYKIETNISKNQFFDSLKSIGKYGDIEKSIYSILKANVIFRLLKPFYSDKKYFEGDPNYVKINKLKYEFDIKLPYVFTNNNSEIELDECYVIYFVKHFDILKKYIFYKLADYLQKKNPSIPGIINKMELQNEREGLQHERELYQLIYKDFNNEYIDINIYNGQRIKENVISGNYELDHFIPHSFCNNNEWWNLTPTTREINGTSNKGNKIPDISKFLNILSNQQYNIYKVIKENHILLEHFIDNRTKEPKFIDDREMINVYMNDTPKNMFINALENNIKSMADIALRHDYEQWRI